MITDIQKKIESIADKYADVVEKRITALLHEDEIESNAMGEINQGLMMLNHIATTWLKLSDIQRENRS